MKAIVSRNLGVLLASTSLAATGLVAAPAMAQDAAQAEDSADQGLGVIIVQARKVSENLQDVPVAVTALSGKELEARNVVRFQDIAAFTPGLYMRSASNSPSGIVVALRGQFQNDSLVTLDPSVGTYVDGVYWARSYGLNGSMLDVSSMQVLKGPQGTLFGRNTTGGAILINTNDPQLGEFSGKLSVSYGRYNEFEPTAVVNLPLGDKIALRLAGKRLSRDGYTTNSVPANAASVISPTNPAVARAPVTGNLNGLKLDNRDRWQGRAKLLAKPTDTLSLLFSAEYFKMDETAPSRNNVYNTGTFDASKLSPPGNTTFNTGGSGLLFTGLLNGGTLATATGIGRTVLNAEIARLANGGQITSQNEIPYVYAKTQTYNFTGTLDTDWGQAKLIAGIRQIDSYASIDLDGTYYPIHFTESQQSVKQESAEIQFTGKAFANALDFAVGAFVFHESGFDQSISITVPTLNPLTSHFWGKIDNDSIGAYTQATWHFTDKLSFTGGLRYSVDDKGLESRNNNYNRTTGTATCSLFSAPAISGPELVAIPACAVRRRDSFSGWSYTAGLEFKPTEDILLYAKTAKGFRSGGQNLRAPTSAFLLPFQPEIAYSYELGFKGEFLDRRVRFNVAAYQTDVNNIQRSTLIAQPGGNGQTATVLGNAGKARFRGLEADLTVLVAEGFTLSAAGAIVDPKYIKYADLSGDRSFERFNGVFKHQFTVGADYSRDISEDTRVNFHVDYAWRGKTPLDSYNYAPNPENAAIIAATTAPALGLLGARASVAFRNFELGVYGRNLTNERKFVQNQLVAPIGYTSATYNEPRTYGVTASVSF